MLSQSCSHFFASIVPTGFFFLGLVILPPKTKHVKCHGWAVRERVHISSLVRCQSSVEGFFLIYIFSFTRHRAFCNYQNKFQRHRFSFLSATPGPLICPFSLEVVCKLWNGGPVAPRHPSHYLLKKLSFVGDRHGQFQGKVRIQFLLPRGGLL